MSEQPVLYDDSPQAATGLNNADYIHDINGLPANLPEIAKRLLANEGIIKPTPEAITPSSQEIANAFNTSTSTFLKATTAPEFHAACMTKDIDPYDGMNTAEYWHTFSDYIDTRIEKLRSQSGNSLQLSVMELLAATPAYIFEQQNLSAKSHTTHGERRQAKEHVSYYNNLIRTFATVYSQTRVDDMAFGLLNVANLTIESKGRKHQASEDIRTCIRGAQHELGFGQLLKYTGYSYRPADAQEDREGTDYITELGLRYPTKIDVKASLSQIEAKQSEKAYAVSADGHITMYSLLKDSEFNGAFFVSEETARTKAATLTRLLMMATNQAASIA